MSDYYISLEEYRIAAKNGISKKNLENRIRNHGWDKKRAMTEPIGSRFRHKEWLELAANNGIKANTYYSRLDNGMDEYEAATTPVRRWDNSYSKKWIEIAKSNGISPDAYRGRVRLGWSDKEAATIPIGQRRKRNQAI